MIQNKHNKDLERKIDLYINGKLNDEQIDELWAELIQDGYYLDYAKSFASLKSIIEEKRTKVDKSESNNFIKVIRYGTAVAIFMVVGVLGILNYNTENSVAVAPIPEIGLDIVRSETGVSVDVTNDILKNAIRLAANGETNDAINLLEDEIDNLESPELIAEFSLTLGSIYYNLGEYTQAVNHFTTATKQSDIPVNVLEKGYWFLANSYFQLDELEKAEIAFETTLSMDGQFSRVAQSYVKALNAMSEK